MRVEPAILRQLLDYNRETGRLTWKERPSHLFGGNNPELTARQWNTKHAGNVAFTAPVHGYRHGKIFGLVYRAHNVAWAIEHGEWPRLLDHRNGDRSDNRIKNLRPATHGQNGMNKGPHKGRLLKGVRERSFGWVARIMAGGRAEHLGTFRTEEEAARAYDAAARKHFGEFARCNYEEETT